MIDKRNLEAMGTTPASGRRTLCWTGLVFALLAGLQGAIGAAEPRLQAPQDAPGLQAGTTYTLRITKEGIAEVSLNAERARLSDIAADLARRLGAWVIVGPSLKDEMVTVKFSDLPLEPALSALAPRVYVDYEIRQGAQPAPVGIYLLAFDDPEPAVNAVVQGKSQGLLITGNTEDTEKTAREDPLQVFYNRNRLTIISKKQPLGLVVMAVADVLGIPAEIKYDAAELVDADIKDTPSEVALFMLSPNVRLNVRVSVNSVDRSLLRLVVAPAAAK